MNSALKSEQWYETWFNSPYYHILYKERNQEEAKHFLDHLISALDISPNSHILDLACGRGRFIGHLLNKKMRVTALDLSKKNIAFASEKFKNRDVRFLRQDMRADFGSHSYDFVFNLFTSFGYFNKSYEDIKIIGNVSRSLKDDGYFIFDYFNVSQILTGLKSYEKVTTGGIEFEIKKELQAQKIIKHILFSDKGEQYSFKEEVELIDRNTFQEYLQKNGLTIVASYGDYDLSEYNPDDSRRMIIISKKSC